MTTDRGLEWEEKEGRERSERDEADVSRRSFLKAMGFALGTAAAACGRGPVQFALPYKRTPEEVTPGRATWYATACGACAARCGALAKSRDGRPIKLEGNPDHPLSRGGLCAVGQASLLGLYDEHRLAAPRRDGSIVPWDRLDGDARAGFEKIRARRGAVRILSTTISSPATRALVGRFLSTFVDGRLVEYDPASLSALLDAHGESFGVRARPRLLLEKSRALAVFDADLLGSWGAPVEQTVGWAARRDPVNGPFSWHIQFESRMTPTGAKADRRARLAPHQVSRALSGLVVRLARRAGSGPSVADESPLSLSSALDEAAERLWAARGEALVVCGTNDLAAQILAIAANHLLGAYGRTLDLAAPSLTHRGDDRAVAALLGELDADAVDGLVILGENPVYDLPDRARLLSGLARMNTNPDRLTLAFRDRLDETGRAVRFLAPARHFLESWDDAETAAGILTLAQPLVRPLRSSRALRETIAAWMGDDVRDDREILRSYWRREIHPRAAGNEPFDRFWERAVHDGFARVAAAGTAAEPFRPAALASVRHLPPPPEPFEILLYSNVAQREGQHAENPWLQELPDPITKITWENAASFSPEAAARFGLAEGDVVEITAGDVRIELPAHLQPGQDDRTIAVPRGYGRLGTDRFADAGPRWIFARAAVAAGGVVGADAGALATLRDGAAAYSRGAAAQRTGARTRLSATQDHHLLNVPEGLGHPGAHLRPIVRATTLAAYAAGEAGHATGHEPHSMWSPDHRYTGHRWGMAIDLSKCSGCSGCVLACQAENNVPVVGRDEVLRSREMHWLRIDRYYEGSGDATEAYFQPMTCHHCDHAPCETVCPVLATVHSSEGLNQQVYNRCVGTRYCSNNCPYKVRRFNWFDYARDDAMANLALNPDLTIRSRGVMEKCSFCIQRIQEARERAKAEGRPIAEGEIRPACAQSCPSKAIIFGDLNDPASAVTQARLDDRHYLVLEELNVKPGVGYLAVVRNRDRV